MNEKLRDYEVSIDHVFCIVERLGELGNIYEWCDLWMIVRAATPSKAKHLFIKAHAPFNSENEYNPEVSLSYTDPIRVRLAKPLPASQPEDGEGGGM